MNQLSRANKGMQGSARGPLQVCYGFYLGVLVGLLTLGDIVSLTLLIPCGTLIFLLDSLVQTPYEGFCLLILYIDLTVACYSFLKREWRKSRFGKEGRMKGA